MRPDARWVAAVAAFALAACHGAATQQLLPGAAPLAKTFSSVVLTDSTTTIKLSPKALSFSAIGAASTKSFTANEAGFKGKFKAKNNCGAALKVSPSSAKGPKGTFKLTPRSFGTSCAVVISDGKRQATLKVTFSKPVRNALVVDPSALNFEAVGAAFVQTFSVSEASYAGNYTAKPSGCSGILTIAARTLVSDPKTLVATETVTPIAAGSCIIVVSDGVQATNVSAVVTTTGIGVNERFPRS
jgi:hypothetical protein